MLRRILLASIVAGAVGGIALTALQSGAVVPLLLSAESYESAADPAPVAHRHGELTHSHASGADPHGHDGHALVVAGDGSAPTSSRAGGSAPTAAPGSGSEAHRHDHSHEHGSSWAPEDGIERTLWTGVSNVATAIGFALLLVAVFAWRGSATWRQGLLWGAAGFFVFFLNPAIGLRPELPGAAATDLLDRQIWWLLTVACSAAGVGLLLLAPRAAAKAGGAVLLVVPHLAGVLHSPRSPVSEAVGGLAPESLAHSFVVAAAATNAAFWIVLGLVAAAAFSRLSRS